ncbi:hypothetical protein [Marinobacter adhaerens]
MSFFSDHRVSRPLQDPKERAFNSVWHRGFFAGWAWASLGEAWALRSR